MIYLQRNVIYDGDGRKNPKYKNEYGNQEKFPVWWPLHTPVYEMEADCFPVPENKLDLP